MKLCLNLYIPLIAVIILSGCGTIVRKAAVNQVAQTFANEKTWAVINSENDPELVWDSMPVAMKAMEVMLAQDPTNSQIKLVLAIAYVSYAQGNLAQNAQMTKNTDYNRSKHLSHRAHNLSLRGRDYALSALDSKYTDFSKNIRINMQATLAQTTIEDVPCLYWAAAGWAGGISSNINDMENVADLPVSVAMMQRALELDEYYNDGAIHEFFIAYEARQPNATKENMAQSKIHFDKVVEYTHGERAYPYVVYAESVAVKTQDVKLFDEMLGNALKVNPNEVMKWRLVNTIAQERAAWLQTQKELLFVDFEEIKE
ncbi:MAG: TRAP transporter TatT component family protein [Lentisphaerota bacterium]